MGVSEAAERAGFSIAVAYSDGDAETAFISDGCANFLGMPKTELDGPGLWERIAPDDHSRFTTEAKATARGDSPSMNVRLRGANGVRLPSEISLSAIELAGRPAIVAMLLDLTSRADAEQALKQSEEFFARLYKMPRTAFASFATGSIATSTMRFCVWPAPRIPRIFLGAMSRTSSNRLTRVGPKNVSGD